MGESLAQVRVLTQQRVRMVRYTGTANAFRR